MICHNGGLINFAEPYSRLKDVNVGGTLEILRLSALGGGIPVHHVSTLGVHLGKAYQSRRITEADVPEDPAGLGGGYNQTKWVADRLVAQAGSGASRSPSTARPASAATAAPDGATTATTSAACWPR